MRKHIVILCIFSFPHPYTILHIYIILYLTLDRPSGGLLCALRIVLVLMQSEQIARLSQLGNRTTAGVLCAVQHQLIGFQVVGQVAAQVALIWIWGKV